MKRLGPILMIAFGSILTVGGLSSGAVRAGAIIAPCDTAPPETEGPDKPASSPVDTTEVPCGNPCDTAPDEAGVQDPCEDPDPCDTIPVQNAPAAASVDVSVEDSTPCEEIDPCDTAVTEVPTDAAVEISVPNPCDTVLDTSSGSGAGLPSAGSSSDIKLVIGLSLVTLGAVLLLVRRRSRMVPLA